MVKINYWICSFDKDDNGNVNYEAELKDTPRNLEDVLTYFDTIDLTKNGFALFKDGIEPYEEDEDNRWKLTHGCVKKVNLRKLLLSCFKANVFKLNDVNGIYINERKISIWLKNPCKIIAFDDLEIKLTKIENQRGPADLDRDWTLGFFSKNNFKITDRFENGWDKNISTRFSGDLRRWVERSYCMRQDEYERAGILLTSNIIAEKEWRYHHIDNRFVYASVKVDLKRAKTLWTNTVMNIVQTFPKIPIIYLAFGFYENQTLKIGVYLSGKLCHLNNDSKSHDKARVLGYQLKMIIYKICGREVMVRITNAVPSVDSNFTDMKYEYRVYEEF